MGEEDEVGRDIQMDNGFGSWEGADGGRLLACRRESFQGVEPLVGLVGLLERDMLAVLVPHRDVLTGHR
eukprot:8648567-Pyramimonas_sp.AAC.1